VVFFGPTRLETFDGIKIRGGSEFLLQTQQALALLRPTSRFAEIQSNVGLIRQGKRSGMKAWAKQPIFVVGKRTWKHSALWYAGAIAHDAYHAKLYADAKKANRDQEPDADSWTGTEAEKKCLAFQRQVLLEVKADEKIISYLDECGKNPTYQGRNRGWKSWLDYLKRWW
jgi:hypothetical protein